MAFILLLIFYNLIRFSENHDHLWKPLHLVILIQHTFFQLLEEENNEVNEKPS